MNLVSATVSRPANPAVLPSGSLGAKGAPRRARRPGGRRQGGQSPDLGRAMAFLNGIGLAAAIEEGASGFLPHVRISRGGLKVDPACPVSNLLHEAGHLAIIPSKYRAGANDNVSTVLAKVLKGIDWSVDPDSIDLRAALNCGDPEASAWAWAWAWAAGKHLGLADDQIVQYSEYEGEGRNVRAMLARGQFAGIHGLAHGGFCVTRAGELERVFGLPAFPKLVRWLQV